MRPWTTIALLSLLATAASSLGQSSYGDGNWQQVCEKAVAAPVERPTATGPLPADKLAGCDSTDLYYGITSKPDYAAALECASYQRLHPDPHNGNMFYGPGVLTMLYANGLGVPRDYDVAIRFACEETWASEAEMALRVGHLEAMRRSHDGSRLDLCDDITSGLSMGACTSIKTGRADAKREQEIAAAVAKLPESSKAAFGRLRKAEAEFEDTRSDREIDLSGTARGMFALEEEKKLRDQFLINLQRFGSGEVPHATAADVAALDRALNSVYQDILHAPVSVWQYGTVKPDGIRETERKWVALADAWGEFTREAYPNLDANAVRAQIIRLRLHQLRSLAPRSE